MKIISDIKHKKVLVSPLDWGLGHAARIVPIVNILRKYNSVIIICGVGAEMFLKTELPDVEIFSLKEKRITYPKGKISFFSFIKWGYVMIYNTFNEFFFVKKVIRKLGIEVVISDNRYGLSFKGLDCFIITHQIAPKLPSGFGLLKKCSDKFFKTLLFRFKKVLVPDFEQGFTLSGNLAGDMQSNKIERIGILSRFCDYKLSEFSLEYDYLILISGQEKQRTVFENILLSLVKTTSKKVIFVRGVSEKYSPISLKLENVVFYNMLTGNALANAFEKSKTIICRSGYSTLCDIVAMKKQAVIIPTPGQTEQEYLANRLDGKFNFKALSQSELIDYKL